MSDLEKINIYVPKHVGDVLNSDAKLFEVYKRDGRTINKNRFLSMLIIGYHNSYVKECEDSFNAVMKELPTESINAEECHAIAGNILKRVILPDIPSRKGKNPVRLSLKPTNDTEGLILNIEQREEEGVPQYLCRMLMSYCEKPITERELLIFRNNYEFLNMACERGLSVTFSTIWNPKSIHEVIPYKLASGREELFNYFLCGEINNQTRKIEAKAYRLNRITNISFGRQTLELPADIKKHLKTMIAHGPQFMINDDDESCVRLTEKGRKSFNRIYYGRPEPERIVEREDGHYYYFRCSKDQILLYFKRFGRDEVEVMSPSSLRNAVIDFHKGALAMYE